MAIINKSTNKSVERLWRKGNPSALLVGMQTSAVLWKTVWKFHTKN